MIGLNMVTLMGEVVTEPVVMTNPQTGAVRASFHLRVPDAYDPAKQQFFEIMAMGERSVDRLMNIGIKKSETVVVQGDIHSASYTKRDNSKGLVYSIWYRTIVREPKPKENRDFDIGTPVSIGEDDLPF